MWKTAVSYIIHISIFRKTICRKFVVINLLWKNSEFLESLSWPSLTFFEYFKKADFEWFPGGEWKLKYLKLSIQTDISWQLMEVPNTLSQFFQIYGSRLHWCAYSYIKQTVGCHVIPYCHQFSWPASIRLLHMPQAHGVTCDSTQEPSQVAFGVNKLCFLGTW